MTIEDGVDARGKKTICLALAGTMDEMTDRLLAEKIVGLLAKGPLNKSELRDRCGGKASRVDWAAGKLEKEGRICWVGATKGGKWEVVG